MLYEQRIVALEAKLRALEIPDRRSRQSPPSGSTSRPLAEKYGLVAAWVVLILLFGAFTPTMFTWPPYASMLGFNAIIVVLTLGLIIPLTRRRFRSFGREHADASGDAGGDPQRQGRMCPIPPRWSSRSPPAR